MVFGAPKNSDRSPTENRALAALSGPGRQEAPVNKAGNPGSGMYEHFRLAWVLALRLMGFWQLEPPKYLEPV